MERKEVQVMEITRVKPVLEDEDGLDEFKPETTSNRVTKEVDLPIKGGWARTQRPRSTGGQQVPRLTVPNDGEELIIKFLDAIPFAAYYVHWIMTDNGRRPYTCAGFDDCPLCGRGDKAKSQDMLNVINLSADSPELVVWQASSDPAKAIEKRAEGKRTSPISKPGLYFSVSKEKGSNGYFAYSLDPVTSDTLEPDWGMKPLTDIQLAEFEKNKYDASVVRVHTISELNEAARYLVTD
jgi:hypothetical protein